MKFSVMSSTLAIAGWFKNDKQEYLKKTCELAVNIGSDGIDWITIYNMDPKEVRRVMTGYGLKTVCYTCFVPELAAETCSERCIGVDKVKSIVDTALALDTKTVMLVTPGKSGTPRYISRRNYIKGLQESIALTRQAGITAIIENFAGPDSPFVISSDLLEAVSEVPGLKLNFDNGNVCIGGEDPATSFKRCAPHVVHAHFKDWKPAKPGTQHGMEAMDGRFYTPALIGEGILDHKSCLKAMRDACYTGYINIEYENTEYLPDEATRKAARYLQELTASLDGQALRAQK